jgi:hypothetical protein
MNYFTKVYRFLTSPVRGLPNFLIIGAQRSGTTALYNYLSQHPDIILPYRKEIHYFSHYYSRGIFWYRAHFLITQKGQITGEASPYYLFHPLAPVRVKKVLPHVKIIIILRNPTERAYSHYWHEVRYSFEKLSFRQAIAKETGRLTGEEEKIKKEKNYYSFAHDHYSYLSRGVYVKQIKRWRKFFSPQQMLILNYLDLRIKPQAVLDKVFVFLGLKPQPIEPIKPPAPSYPPLESELKQYLDNYFKSLNQELFEYLGKDKIFNL